MKISMKDIDKAFSGNKVLEHASLDIADGEIHSLMGENGAGKSTLMKILTGEYTRDNGTIFVDGQEVTYKNIQEAEKAGIVFIHQELNIVYDLTVTENLFLGKEIIGRFGVLDTKTMNEKAGEALARLGVDFDPRTLMRNLSVGQQQMVEICKAFMVNAKTIIMDEPTAALTQEESEVLFKVIRVLKSQGVSIIYISHRMEEIFELSDRVSVLRDGKTIGTCNIEDIDMNGIVKMMIGREIGDRYPERDTKIGDVVLEVDKLGRSGVFDDVSFKVHAGEVLGVSGLMGAGRTEIMQALFGYRPYDTGSVKNRRCGGDDSLPESGDGRRDRLCDGRPEDGGADARRLHREQHRAAQSCGDQREKRTHRKRQGKEACHRRDRYPEYPLHRRQGKMLESERRQSAEGRLRQMDQYESEDSDYGRTDPRRGYRRQKRNIHSN